MAMQIQSNTAHILVVGMIVLYTCNFYQFLSCMIYYCTCLYANEFTLNYNYIRVIYVCILSLSLINCTSNYAYCAAMVFPVCEILFPHGTKKLKNSAADLETDPGHPVPSIVEVISPQSWFQSRYLVCCPVLAHGLRHHQILYPKAWGMSDLAQMFAKIQHMPPHAQQNCKGTGWKVTCLWYYTYCIVLLYAECGTTILSTYILHETTVHGQCKSKELLPANAMEPQPPMDSATLKDPLPKITLPLPTSSFERLVEDSSMMSFNRSSGAFTQISRRGGDLENLFPDYVAFPALPSPDLPSIEHHRAQNKSKSLQYESAFGNTVRCHLQEPATCPACSRKAQAVNLVQSPSQRSGKTLLSGPLHNPQPPAHHLQAESSHWFASLRPKSDGDKPLPHFACTLLTSHHLTNRI